MATVRFITVNGQRHELDESEPQTEMRCDHCGKFATKTETSSVSVNVTHRGAILPSRFFDLHAACLAPFLATLAQQLGIVSPG